MAELTPHPLVMRVALKLAQQDVGTLRDDAAHAFEPHMPPSVQGATTPQRAKAVRDLTDAELATALESADDGQKNQFARAYANQANLAGMSLFAGFLGGEIEHEARTWRLVYLDSRLNSWMLVPEASIVVMQRLDDANAPSGKRDVLWIDATANLITGSGPRTNDGRFLVGELTRAGDYAPATSGGTFSVASALLCEAATPGCCMYTRTRC